MIYLVSIQQNDFHNPQFHHWKTVHHLPPFSTKEAAYNAMAQEAQRDHTVGGLLPSTPMKQLRFFVRQVQQVAETFVPYTDAAQYTIKEKQT